MKISLTIMRWLAIAWTIILLIGCLTPHEELPDELVTLNDKAQHLAIFALFAVLWRMTGYKLSLVAAAGILLGALIEVLQYVLPINRSGDWIDLLADSLGVALGLILVPGIRKIIHTPVGQ